MTGRFADGSPAVTLRHVGRGTVTYCGFLPGLSYFKPAIPRRPVDRGATDESMSHFIPTDFDPGAGALIGASAEGIERPVACSEPRVETMIVQSDKGAVVTLVNWTPRPVQHLSLSFPGAARFKDAQLASGRPVSRNAPGGTEFTLELDVADALILR